MTTVFRSTNFVNAHVADLPAVAHGSVAAAELAAYGLHPADVLDFSVNTNPLGPAPNVLAAVQSTDWTRYPGDDELPLREGLARAAGVRSDQVVLGNGSSELLWLICLAVLRDGDMVDVHAPTFGEYARAARVVGARVTELWSPLEHNPASPKPASNGAAPRTDPPAWVGDAASSNVATPTEAPRDEPVASDAGAAQLGDPARVEDSPRSGMRTPAEAPRHEHPGRSAWAADAARSGVPTAAGESCHEQFGSSPDTAQPSGPAWSADAPRSGMPTPAAAPHSDETASPTHGPRSTASPQAEHARDRGFADPPYAAPQPRLAFICNPNNPTGDYLAETRIRAFLEANPSTLVVLDEAYAGFVPHRWPSAPLLDSAPNLVILRSLTKDHALPGLRLGYLLASADLARAIESVRPPWSVNSGALRAGLATLAPEAIAHVDRARETVSTARTMLTDGLRRLGYSVHPSDSNFLLVQVSNAAAFRQALLPSGFVVRDCTSFGLPHHVRIACRKPADCTRLLQAIAALRSAP